MANDESTSSPRPRVWMALAGAPVSWAAQALVVGWIVHTACAHAGVPSLALRVLALVATMAGGVGAIVALLVATEAWAFAPESGAVEPATRRDLVAATAVFVSLCFLIGILLTGFAAVAVNVCEALG